jgi:hypothetical protein
MPMASNKFAGGTIKNPHCPMPAPDAVPKIEGTVDGQRYRDQDDASSRKAGTSGRVTKESSIRATANVAVPPPHPYPERRKSR